MRQEIKRERERERDREIDRTRTALLSKLLILTFYCSLNSSGNKINNTV